MKMLLVVLAICCLLLPACSKEKDMKIDELTKKVEQLTKQKEQSSLKETYESQERCGKRAEEIFKKKYGNSTQISKEGLSTNSYDYACHYNRKLNKCFMLINKVTCFYGKKKGSFFSFMQDYKELKDINENVTYGTFLHDSDEPPACQVLGKPYKTQQEWDALVKPYMEE